jgi:hypothetical protein
MELKRAELDVLIERRLEGFSQAQMLLKDLANRTFSFFQQLASHMRDLYHKLLIKGFGDGPTYTKASEDQCWRIVTTLL